VIIYYFCYFHSSDFYPQIPSVTVLWNGILVWYEDQPIWLVEVASPLPFAVASEFVVMAWEETHFLKSGGCSHIVQPLAKQSRPYLSKLTDAFLVIVGELFKFIRAECYFQSVFVLSYIICSLNRCKDTNKI